MPLRPGTAEVTGLLVFSLTGAAFLLLTASQGLVGVRWGDREVPGHRTGAPPWRWRRGGAPHAKNQDADVLDTALMIDLLAAILTAGAPIGVALTSLAGSCPPSLARGLRAVASALSLGADWDVAWNSAVARSDVRTGEILVVLSSALRFAALTGASSAGIVHTHASQLRRRRNSEAEQRAATLGVRLVVPLGLCYLPAFICFGVLPVVFALVPEW
ncbi:type II secretion system F family protein [Arthrobacter sp. Sr33]|nr:type II secretion system F family protein [Arthrobacter sp. CAL618]